MSVDCFGRKGGPWAERRGVDPVAQAVSGIADEPCAQGICSLVGGGPLSDPLGGYLGAAGAVTALVRRSERGGSYAVDVSLARIASWVAGLGVEQVAMDGEGFDNTYRAFVEPRRVSMDSAFGRSDYLAPVAQ